MVARVLSKMFPQTLNISQCLFCIYLLEEMALISYMRNVGLSFQLGQEVLKNNPGKYLHCKKEKVAALKFLSIIILDV